MDTQKIDWTQDLEAVHTDGRVFDAARFDNTADTWPDNDGQYHITVKDEYESLVFAEADGSQWGKTKRFTIRNATPTRTALEQRMEALVRRMAGNVLQDDVTLSTEHYLEARAIVAELPEPVDGDLEAAKLLQNEYARGNLGQMKDAFLAAIKRGRALERGE